ncbi:MAG: peptidyl-prolyl cis-trans isomerase [Candidatus Latescibacterota bacterium]
MLARVGSREILANDLLSYERSIEVGDSIGYEEHLENLKVLIDRELLITEAQGRGLEDDPDFKRVLLGDIEDKLAEMMFNLEVEGRSEPTVEEIESAYATGDWDRQVVSIELFLPDEATALRVRNEILAGLDIFEAGRLYSVDRLMHIPMGGVQQFVYNVHDGPEEVVQRVFQIPAGSLSSPIPLFKGFVLSYVAEYRDVSRDEVMDELVQYVRKEKRRLLRGAYLQHLNKSLDLKFDPEGVDRAVSLLVDSNSGNADKQISDSTRVVYSYGSTTVTLSEVIDAVGGASARWPEISAENLIAEIKNTVLPALLMSANARQRGVDESEEFLSWKRGRSEDLLLSLLRRNTTADISVSDGEVETRYQQTKRRFRIPGYARVRDLLVATQEEAQVFKQSVENGADFEKIIRDYTLRKGRKKGVYRVFALQANQYGTAWMNYVLNVPIGTLQGPIQAEGGYSILEVVERVADDHYSLEESRVRSAVTRDVRQGKERAIFNELVAQVRAERSSEIIIYEDHVRAISVGSTGM